MEALQLIRDALITAAKRVRDFLREECSSPSLFVFEEHANRIFRHQH